MTRFIAIRTILTITTLTALLSSSASLLADGRDADKDPDSTKIATTVTQFVPPAMAQVTAASPNEFPLRSSFQTGQLDSSGKTYIVAGYANGSDGRVRLLSPQSGGSYVLAGEVTRIGMVGENIHIDLTDVDGDGFADIVASFSGARGPSMQWLFKWTGSQFVDLTPLENDDGITTTALRSAVFTDLDGDGKPEIVNATARAGSYSDGSTNPEESFEVYKFRNGRFEDAGSLVFFARYLGGGASGQTRSFSVNRTNITYTMTIVNGDASGNHRVMKGNVTLNGSVVATATELKSPLLSFTVHLAQSNQVAVAIDGPHDQTLLVTIRPDEAYATQPVTPKAQCVWLDGSGRFTASFGYENPNPSQMVIEIGDDNSFIDRANRGQPAGFLPGVHDAAFWTQSNGEALTWTLNGTAVSATAALPACTDIEPVSRSSTGGVRAE